MFFLADHAPGFRLVLCASGREVAAGPWDERKAKSVTEPFYPRQVYMDAVVMVGVFLTLVLLARFVPFPLADKANPADTSFVPIPEWYFLFYYELLKHIHGPLEPLATWVLPCL